MPVGVEESNQRLRTPRKTKHSRDDRIAKRKPRPPLDGGRARRRRRLEIVASAQNESRRPFIDSSLRVPPPHPFRSPAATDHSGPSALFCDWSADQPIDESTEWIPFGSTFVPFVVVLFLETRTIVKSRSASADGQSALRFDWSADQPPTFRFWPINDLPS